MTAIGTRQPLRNVSLDAVVDKAYGHVFREQASCRPAAKPPNLNLPRKHQAAASDRRSQGSAKCPTSQNISELW